MASVPSDRPWWDALVDDNGSGVTGTVWNKAQIKNQTDALDGGSNGIGTTNQVISALASGWRVPQLTTVEWDSHAYYNGPGKFRIAPGKSGLYLVTVNMIWDVQGTTRGIQVLRAGTTLGQIFLPVTPAPGGTAGCLTILRDFAAGQDVDLQVWSDSATNVNPGCRFAIVRL